MDGHQETTSWADARDAKIDLRGPDRTVNRLLIAAAAAFGDSIALTDGVTSVSYADLPDWAARAAGGLQAAGVNPGDRVVVVSANRLEVLEVFLGCSWLNAIFVPLNPDSPIEQLATFLHYIEPKAILAEAACITSVEEANGAQRDSTIRVGQIGDGAASDAAWLWGPGDANDLTPSDPSSPLAILMTSGTTGVSKGVVCPHGQFIQWGDSVGGLLNLTPSDIAYTCLPLFHTNALNGVIQSLIHGSRFHIGGRFSVSRFWERIRDAEATVTYLLGATVSMLLTRPPSDDDHSHRVSRILAPGTTTGVVTEFERRFGTVLMEGHGMTETNLSIAPPPKERRLGFMGTVVKGFEAVAVDENGLEVADGTPGELLLRTSIPSAFSLGYWRMPEVTAEANRGGWFHSGDRVVLEQGWFRFLDRIKDVIRRRGENISAWEVEQVLDMIPGVIRSAVIPVPSEFGEDEVMAFIRADGYGAGDFRAIIDACEMRLPRYAVPRYLDYVTEFPLTDTGKIRKHELRARGVTDTTWDATEYRASRSR
ncbi:MAG: AMP-binding protein [Candidatus Nanopelagicales bacterium]